MADIVVLKRANFFSIDNDIIDVHAKTIGAIGVAIYAVLARYAHRRTGECWPAVARIQRTLNLGRSTVKRHLHRLEAAGLIAVGKRWSEHGDRTSNLYTLLNPGPSAIVARQQATTDARARAPVDGNGGGSTATRPPVRSEGEGGSTANPQEPDPPNPKNETTQDAASLKKTPRQQTCPHPALDIHRLADGIVICFQCFVLLENGMQQETPCHDKVDAA